MTGELGTVVGRPPRVGVLCRDRGWGLVEQTWIAELLLGLVGGKWLLRTETNGRPGLLLPGGVAVEAEELHALFQRATLALETDTGARDRHGRFDECSGSWELGRPIVDDAASTLALRLVEAGESIPRREPSLRVVLTHDVDWVTPREPVSLAKSLVRAVRPQGRWVPLGQAVSGDAFLRSVERLLELEAEAGARSWFFMLAGPYRPSRFGSRYACTWRAARRIVAAVRAAGCLVGLHSSYWAREARSYARETARLSECLGEPVRVHRSHYLRFDRERLWEDLEEAGIEVDSSVGLASGLGFRAGLATPYRPFRSDAARAARVVELPLVFMDRPTDVTNAERRLRELGEILERARSVRGWVSILIHPESLAVEPRWADFYRRTLALCRDLDADLTGSVPELESSEDHGTDC